MTAYHALGTLFVLAGVRDADPDVDWTALCLMILRTLLSMAIFTLGLVMILLARRPRRPPPRPRYAAASLREPP
jgi:hypothetical protein